MRSQWLVFLASTVLLLTTGALSTPYTLTSNSLRNDGPATRKLSTRIHSDENTSVDSAEDRGVAGSTVENLTNSLKLTDELDDLLKAGKSTNYAFKFLALDKADDLFANAKLHDWIAYMKAFNKKAPSKRTTVIATLTAHYGDDGVAKMIEAAKQVRTTSAFAKRVQSEQTQRWLMDGKTPKQVFKLLKLDKAGTDLFAQPQIVTWAKYFDDFHKVKPSKKPTLFSFLRLRYSEETLAHMLIAAEKVPTTKTIATRVQAELTSLWLTRKKEPADVFKLLKLDEVGMSLLKDPVFNAWLKYTDDFRKFHFGTKLTTISVLGKFYQDDVLVKMILAASKHPSTSEIAKRLSTEQRRHWYMSKFAPEHVFKLLRLDEGNVPLLENPLFSTWTKYMAYFSDLRPKEDVSLLTELNKVYKERDLTQVLVEAYQVPRTKGLATKLLDAQMKQWLFEKRDYLEVFYLLRVEGATAKDVRKVLYNNYRYAFDRLPKENPVRSKS
ncbi:hypothetical protein P3T76_007731 [Phytophthora citrophthora]|uniref:RxLR effector PexRD54 WY domain-containing protein n=1 Tax=Phytophthora citrophthora TaxID=4793 RepID=A0AAD9GM96_9STRA|nr:hypothetical protein P3T76_007731 [Phytophthora citrophthora]